MDKCVFFGYVRVHREKALNGKRLKMHNKRIQKRHFNCVLDLHRAQRGKAMCTMSLSTSCPLSGRRVYNVSHRKLISLPNADCPSHLHYDSQRPHCGVFLFVFFSFLLLLWLTGLICFTLFIRENNGTLTHKKTHIMAVILMNVSLQLFFDSQTTTAVPRNNQPTHIQPKLVKG